jgi:hypothetical protein
MIQVVNISETDRWDHFIQQHPQGTIFHSRTLVNTFGKHAQFSPLALAAVDSCDEIIGIVVGNRVSTVYNWNYRYGCRAIMYAEPLIAHGPLQHVALSKLLNAYDDVMRPQTVFSEIRPISDCSEFRESLQEAGYVYHSYHNYEMRLDAPIDQIFRRLPHSRRNNLRVNQRRGIVVKEGDLKRDAEVFYQHLKSSYARAGVPFVEKQLFESVANDFPADQYRLTFALLDGRPIASSCHLMFKDRIHWWYAGTEHVNGIAAQASLVWEAMTWGVEHGYGVYDFGGAGWDGEHYGPGVFKSRFGANHIQHGRYRKIYSPWGMKLASLSYQVAQPLFRSQSNGK